MVYELFAGVSPTAELIGLARGVPAARQRPPLSVPLATFTLFPGQTGRLRAIHGLDEVAALPDVIRVVAAVRPGDVISDDFAIWAVNLPVALAAPERWAEFYTFSSERVGTFAATWTVLNDLGVVITDVAARNLWGLVAFAVGAVAIVAAGWHTHQGREWVLFTPIVAWFLLTNKVWSPQFDLWLVPLLVLTSRRTWPLAVFGIADIAVYWTEFWYLARRAGFTPSGSYEMLAAASALRAVVLLTVIVLSVRDPAPDWTAVPAGADSQYRSAMLSSVGPRVTTRSSSATARMRR